MVFYRECTRLFLPHCKKWSMFVFSGLICNGNGSSLMHNFYSALTINPIYYIWNWGIYAIHFVGEEVWKRVFFFLFCDSLCYSSSFHFQFDRREMTYLSTSSSRLRYFQSSLKTKWIMSQWFRINPIISTKKEILQFGLEPYGLDIRVLAHI